MDAPKGKGGGKGKPAAKPAAKPAVKGKGAASKPQGGAKPQPASKGSKKPGDKGPKKVDPKKKVVGGLACRELYVFLTVLCAGRKRPGFGKEAPGGGPACQEES